jgi:hypothetical protein
MPVTNEKYDQLKIDRLKHFLTDMEAKGQPRPYEIFVDGLKVVPKTEELKEFENYEYYINEDTERIRILIYNTAASPRNDQYCFYMQPVKAPGSLNGLGNLDGIIQEKLEARDREHEVRLMKQELEETKKQLEEAEEYSEELERQLALAKNNKHKLGNLDLVELGSVVLERMAAKNVATLEKIGLAGLVTPSIDPASTETTSASFEKQHKDEKPLQAGYLSLLQQMDAVFGNQELEMVMQIIQKFSEEPSHLQTVAELLNIETKTI